MTRQYQVPSVRSGDDKLTIEELVFTKAEITSIEGNLITLEFAVGGNAIVVRVAKGTARELMEKLAFSFNLDLIVK